MYTFPMTEGQGKISTKSLACVLEWEWELAYPEHRVFPAAASEPLERWLDGGGHFEKFLIGQGSWSERKAEKLEDTLYVGS